MYQAFLDFLPRSLQCFKCVQRKLQYTKINLLKVQKNWFVILFQVDSTYISNSISQIGNSFAFHLTSLISLVDYQLLDFLFFFVKSETNFSVTSLLKPVWTKVFWSICSRIPFQIWGNLRKLFYLPLSIKMRRFCIHEMNDFELL